MNTGQCRGCAALFIARLLGFALKQTARASQLTWERIELDAHLDNCECGQLEPPD